MIASLTGQLSRKATDYLIVNVAGIGYQVYLPLSTYYSLPEEGEEVSLHIHTHLREDSLSLFGFLTGAEKDMFLLLMAVSGIGPKLALAILSSFSVRDLTQAITTSDDSKLCTIPGIGKKTAARMILELKDRIKVLEPYFPYPEGTALPGDIHDAVSALVNLGYKRTIAEEALKKIRGNRQNLTLEELIREGLNVLIKR
ncbi:MAG TPA: Holliday junction branch migration protein RuvA [Nitrospirota bacterium]|nr:Holliday junction branch migration protein RuvA [Nitrospirota bacterium]